MINRDEVNKSLWTAIYVLSEELTEEDLAVLLMEKTTLPNEIIEHIVDHIGEIRMNLRGLGGPS